MRSKPEKRKQVTEQVAATHAAMREEIAASVLDFADMVEPMVRDGRVATLRALCKKVNGLVNNDPFLFDMIERAPWLMAAAAFLLPNGPQAAAAFSDEAALYDVGDPESVLNSARLGGARALVTLIFGALRERGVGIDQLTDDGPHEDEDEDKDTES